MNASKLRSLGYKLSVEDSQLRVVPTPPQELIEEIREHKAEIIEEVLAGPTPVEPNYANVKYGLRELFKRSPDYREYCTMRELAECLYRFGYTTYPPDPHLVLDVLCHMSPTDEEEDDYDDEDERELWEVMREEEMYDGVEPESYA